MIPRLARWILLPICATLGAVRAEPAVDAARQANNGLLRQRHQERALFVRDRRLTETPQAVPQLLLFCRQRGVTSLFVAAHSIIDPLPLHAADAYAWRRLLSEGHRQGLMVYAVIGNTGWIHDRGRALDAADRLARFCRQGLPGDRFDGVLLEFSLLTDLQRLFPPPDQLEPPSMEELLNASELRRDLAASRDGRVPAERPTETGPELPPEVPSTDLLYPSTPTYDRQLSPAGDLKSHELLRQFLAVLSSVRAYLAGPRHGDLRLAVGLSFPAWLRLPLGFGENVKYAHEHFIDVADFVVVHNLPGETSEIARAAEGVLRYAGETGKRAFLRVELTYPALAVPRLLSAFGRDELFLEELLAEWLRTQGTAPGFAGIALNEYHGYRLLPAVRDVPLPPVRPAALRPNG